MTDDELRALFDAARDETWDPAPAFLAELAADAARRAQARSPARQVGRAFGGWLGGLALAAATAAGLLLGVLSPGLITDGAWPFTGDMATWQDPLLAVEDI